MSDTPKLLPCPFCREPAELDDNFGRMFWVQCANDHSDGHNYDSAADAIAAWNTRAAAPAAQVAAPIPMILLCPACGKQHVDAPETGDWTNPPHRSHLCHACGCIWRPADVPTIGVERIATRGKADTWDAAAAPAVVVDEASGNHKLDTGAHVFFYEQDFYVLSNFSAFRLQWKGLSFDTSEAAYHWEKFPDAPEVQDMLLESPSAHEAFKLAESQKCFRRRDWDDVKLDVMREILRAKAEQHEYVRRKLLATGDRILVEDSWRDSYWGWGPNRDGQNMLGKLWMEVRADLARSDALAAALKGKDNEQEN